MRTFIAIPLPEAVRSFLKQLRDGFMTAEADVKWVEPANMHLTLLFLGEISEDSVDTVNEAMRSASAGTGRYTMELSLPGGFPSSASPRVIWMGISRGAEETKKIAAGLAASLSPLMAREEREFCCHITLGRVRSSRNRRELARLVQTYAAPRPLPSFTVERIIFCKSTLSPKGAVYEELSSCRL